MGQPYFDKFPEAVVPEDEDMLALSCPRPSCGAALRITKSYLVTWGDEVMAQCDSCGMIVRATNNTSMKFLTEVEANGFVDTYISTVRDAPEEWAPSNPHMVGIRKRKAEREAKKSLVKKCDTCPGSFTPRANAKTELQTRFCPHCRTNGFAKKKLDEEKKAKNPPKKAAAKKKKKKPVARKK